MDKDNLTFLIVCVIITLIAFGMYRHNCNEYATKTVMSVMPIGESTQTTEMSIVAVSKDMTNYTKNRTYQTVSTTTTASITTTATESITTTQTTTQTTKTTHTTTTNHVETESITTVKTEPSFPISLNSITFDELLYIKGIGEVTAQKIIDYRSSIGYFTSRYQLLEIDGIGENKMNTIMEYTYIEDENLDYYYEETTLEVAEEPQPDEPQRNVQNNFESIVDGDSNVVEVEVTTYVEPITYPIDLNTATLDELITIPNVTIEIAQEILNLRDTIQYYSNPYELLYIDGVTEQYLSEIIEYICVE